MYGSYRYMYQYILSNYWNNCTRGYSHAKFVKNSSPLFNSRLLLILLPCKGLAFGLDPERTHLKGTGIGSSHCDRQTDRLRQGMLSMWVQWEWHMCDNIIGVINAFIITRLLYIITFNFADCGGSLTAGFLIAFRVKRGDTQ